ncbi:hypothetical protein AADX40_15470 [Aeromonas veronii]|uniref:hypothetical protein n=1 Tax=Aeromonas TaxID=642 RepID=UPI0031592302
MQQLTRLNLSDFQRCLERALNRPLASLEPGTSYHRLSSRMEGGQAGADVDVELLEGSVLMVSMTEWSVGDAFSRSSPVSVRAEMNELGELTSGKADEGGLDVLLLSIPQMTLG